MKEAGSAEPFIAAFGKLFTSMIYIYMIEEHEAETEAHVMFSGAEVPANTAMLKARGLHGVAQDAVVAVDGM